MYISFVVVVVFIFIYLFFIFCMCVSVCLCECAYERELDFGKYLRNWQAQKLTLNTDCWFAAAAAAAATPLHAAMCYFCNTLHGIHSIATKTKSVNTIQYMYEEGSWKVKIRWTKTNTHTHTAYQTQLFMCVCV